MNYGVLEQQVNENKLPVCFRLMAFIMGGIHHSLKLWHVNVNGACLYLFVL